MTTHKTHSPCASFCQEVRSRTMRVTRTSFQLMRFGGWSGEETVNGVIVTPAATPERGSVSVYSRESASCAKTGSGKGSIRGTR